VMIAASWLGVRDRPGGIYDTIVKAWCRTLLLAAGTRIVVRGRENLPEREPRIFVCNHVSWFDVLALAVTIPRYKFVAKAELFRVPIFGRGLRAAGMVEIHRENRKAAFEAYKVAAERIKSGDSVIVFPEGTRGTDYSIRSFKKGPFVLGIAAGVPMVPVIVHGTIEVNAKGSFRIHRGTVNIDFLDPVTTAGLTYEDRDALSAEIHRRIVGGMERLHGVHSPTISVRANEASERSQREI
jgi:1-acyl-sn-glycerol-3-phosphate acyltransferase